mmetsp:Transcript_18218/g.39215  ORF Transcript_18218/g.39215 Transcript_18218/m.39215 type:complete len:455 (-) Transcript_18218:372-1736(-)
MILGPRRPIGPPSFLTSTAVFFLPFYIVGTIEHRSRNQITLNPWSIKTSPKSLKGQPQYLRCVIMEKCSLGFGRGKVSLPRSQSYFTLRKIRLRASCSGGVSSRLFGDLDSAPSLKSTPSRVLASTSRPRACNHANRLIIMAKALPNYGFDSTASSIDEDPTDVTDALYRHITTCKSVEALLLYLKEVLQHWHAFNHQHASALLVRAAHLLGPATAREHGQQLLDLVSSMASQHMHAMEVDELADALDALGTLWQPQDPSAARNQRNQHLQQDNGKAYTPPECLVNAVQDALLGASSARLRNASPREMAALLWGCSWLLAGTPGRVPGQVSPRSTQLLTQMLLLTWPHLGSFRGQDLVKAVQALHRLGYKDAALMTSVTYFLSDIRASSGAGLSPQEAALELVGSGIGSLPLYRELLSQKAGRVSSGGRSEGGGVQWVSSVAQARAMVDVCAAM